MTSADQKRKRSTIPKAEARRRYIEAAELVVLDQIRADSRLLDARTIAVGPFARLDANAVAARDGRTRGAINNLFGSQAAFQAETMALALSARDWIERIEYPDPADFPMPTRGSTPSSSRSRRGGRSMVPNQPRPMRSCGPCG